MGTGLILENDIVKCYEDKEKMFYTIDIRLKPSSITELDFTWHCKEGFV